jgi:protein disulfide-isomerase A1
MFPAKPTSRSMLFTFTILLLLSSTIFVTANEDPTVETDNDGADSDLQELIAIDEQEGGGGEEQQQGDQQKEAEVLSKAQRIVLELNSDNARRVIDQNEFVLILGYAPWCARSAELMPQFAEAANKLKELGSPVLMAKLDAERYPKVASTLGIKGFPTLLLFVNGTSQVYTGGFSGYVSFYGFNAFVS